MTAASTNLITGTDAAETLYGTDGPDLIDGVGGNDWLEGGPGDDTLAGGSAGFVLYWGDEGVDTVMLRVPASAIVSWQYIPAHVEGVQPGFFDGGGTPVAANLHWLTASGEGSASACERVQFPDGSLFAFDTRPGDRLFEIQSLVYAGAGGIAGAAFLREWDHAASQLTGDDPEVAIAQALLDTYAPGVAFDALYDALLATARAISGQADPQGMATQRALFQESFDAGHSSLARIAVQFAGVDLHFNPSLDGFAGSIQRLDTSAS